MGFISVKLLPNHWALWYRFVNLNGDFRDKTRTLVRSDEIGQLADALASMRDNLRRLMKNVNVSVTEQLAASSKEFNSQC